MTVAFVTLLAAVAVTQSAPLPTTPFVTRHVCPFLWVGGRVTTMRQFWPDQGRPDDGRRPAILERSLVREWWVHITRAGRTGWIQAYGRGFAGSNACDAMPLP